MTYYLAQKKECSLFALKTQILTFLGLLPKLLPKLLMILAMLALLASCGSGKVDEDDELSQNNSSESANNNEGASGNGTNVAVITPPDAQQDLGEFSFDAQYYTAGVGGAVDVTINLTGNAPDTAFTVTLQEQINGINVPSILLKFDAGQTSYTYEYDANGLAVGTLIRLGFMDLPQGYNRASLDLATISIDSNEIEFGAPAYTVKAGKQVDVQLKIAQSIAENLDVPVTIYDAAANETIIKTVTIPAGQKIGTLPYLAASSRADGTLIRYSIPSAPAGFGLGIYSTAQVNIIANPNVEVITVNFVKNSYNVVSGQQANIAVKMNSNLSLIGDVTIPYEYKADNSSYWTSYPLTFETTPGQNQTPDTASFIYNAVNLPSGAGGTFRITQAGLDTVQVTSGSETYAVSLGQPHTASISVIGDNIGFKQTAFNVDYGQDAIIAVQLEDPAHAFFNAPLIITSQKSDGTVQIENITLPFQTGEQEKTYNYFTGNKLPNSKITFSFGDLSGTDYVVAIGKETSIVTLVSNDVNFAAATPVNIDVPYNTAYNVNFTLSHSRFNATQIPLLITIHKIDGTSSTHTDAVTFPASATKASYSFFASSYNYSVGDKIEIAFDTVNVGIVGLAIGSNGATRKLTVTGSNIVEFVNSSYDITLGQAVDIPIQLQEPATDPLTLNVKREFKDTNNNIIASESGTESIVFAVGQTKPSQEISYDSALATMLGSVTYSFVNVPGDIGVTAGKETSVVTLTDARVNFDATTYDVRAGGAVDVKIVINTALANDSTIGLIKTKIVPGAPPVVSTENIDVVLLANQTSVTFAYDASTDVADSTIQYKIDGNNLPAGAVLGGDDTAVITVKADIVKFAHSNYTVRAGASVDVVITLTAEAGLSYPLTIPLEVAFEGDPTKYAAGNVVFNAITETQKTFTYTAPAIAGGQTLSFGTLPIGLMGDGIAQINVTDSSISFDAPTYSVRSAGDSVDVTVNLASPAIGALNIPLNVVASDGSSPAPNNIAFADGETQKTFSYLATSAAGTIITYSFGTLPVGVTAAAGAQTVITVLDGTVNFELPSYSVHGNTTLAIKVELASPANKAISIPINTAGAISATSNVDFAIGESIKTFNYIADINAGSYILSFGTLPAGVTAGGVSTIEITDSSISFDASNYTVRAGDTVSINVELASPATSALSIPLNVTAGSVSALNFASGDTQATVIYSAPATASTETISFGTLPVGVTAGANLNAIISVTDSGISFDSTAYDVRSGNILDIKLVLASPATSALSIPLNVSYAGGTPTSVGNVTFADGVTIGTFSYTAPAVTGIYSFTFGTLPVGVSAGTGAQQTDVTVSDSGVKFDSATYTARVGETLAIKVILTSGALGTAIIPINVTPTGGSLTSVGSVTFNAGDTEKILSYTASATAGDYKFTFGTLPASVLLDGTIDETMLTVLDNTIQFAASTYQLRVGDSTSIKVELTSPAITALTIPVNTIGATNASTNLSFAIGETAKTFTYVAGTNLGAHIVTFGTLPIGVSKAGVIDETIVTITDSSISFDASSYTVRAGGTINITVNLATAPDEGLAYLIPVNTQGGTNATESVIFSSGETQKTFSYTAATAGTYTLDFGTLPAGVTKGAIDESVVTVTDSTIEFDASSYTVRAGGTINITVNLATAPDEGLAYVIPVNTQGGTNATESVIFSSGETQKTFSYTPATNGTYTLDFGTLPAGVTKGAIDESVVTVADSGISFELTNYTVRAGDTISINVELASPATSALTIPLIVGAGSVSTLNFASGDTQATVTYSAPATDGTQILSFGTLPAGVTAGANSNANINVTDSAIDFELTNYTVRAGDTISINIELASPATSALTIPLIVGAGSVSALNFASGDTQATVTYSAPATDGTQILSFGTLPAGVTAGANPNATITVTDSAIDFEFTTQIVAFNDTIDIKAILASPATSALSIPLTVTAGSVSALSFAVGDSEATITYNSPAIAGVHTIAFGATLPVGVSAGAIDETLVDVGNIVDFASTSYVMNAEDSLTITLNLVSPAASNVTIPLTAVVSDAILSNGPSNVTFNTGEASKTFDYVAAAITTDQQITFGLGTLPTNMALGTNTTSLVKIIAPRTLSFTNSSYSDLYINEPVNIELSLDVPFTTQTTVPLYRIASKIGGGTIETKNINAIFAAGATTVTIAETAPAFAENKDADIRYSFNSGNANFPVNASVDASKATSEYTARGYFYQFNNQAISGYDQIVNAEPGDTIYVPLLLDAPLKAKIDLYMVVKNNAGGAWSSLETALYSGFGTLGTAEQLVPYVLPNSTDADYEVKFIQFDFVVQKGILVQPSAVDHEYELRIVSGNVVSFAQATQQTAAGTTANIKVELVKATSSAVSIPLNISFGGAIIATQNVNFAANSDEATFSYNNATIGDYTFSFDTANAIFPAGMVEGLIDESVLTLIPTVSFKDASYGTIYVNQPQDIALTVNAAFAVDTTLPLTRKTTSLDENTTYSIDNITASFVAGATEGYVNAGAVNATVAPIQKDRKIIFSFHTSHANWDNNVAADAANAESQYIVAGYQYEFADEPSLYHHLYVPNASTIEVSFTLNVPLQAKTNFTFLIRHDGGSWINAEVLELTNHGVVGQTQQSFLYTLPDSDLSSDDLFDDYYGVRFRLIDKPGVGLNPSKSFEQNIYDYRINVVD